MAFAIVRVSHGSSSNVITVELDDGSTAAYEGTIEDAEDIALEAALVGRTDLIDRITTWHRAALDPSPEGRRRPRAGARDLRPAEAGMDRPAEG